LQCSDEQLLSKASLFWNSLVINNNAVDISQSLIKAAKKANKNGAHVSLTQQISDSQTMDSAGSLPDPTRPFYAQSPGLLLQSSPIRDKDKGRERLKQESEAPRNARSTPQQAAVPKKRPQFVNEVSRDGYVTIEPKKLSGVFTQHQKEVRMYCPLQSIVFFCANFIYSGNKRGPRLIWGWLLTWTKMSATPWNTLTTLC
jgi:hypothetical protein